MWPLSNVCYDGATAWGSPITATYKGVNSLPTMRPGVAATQRSIYDGATAWGSPITATYKGVNSLPTMRPGVAATQRSVYDGAKAWGVGVPISDITRLQCAVK